MTARALIIGLVFVLLLAIGIPYSDLVMKGTWIGLTAFPISSFFVLFVLVAFVNAALRKLRWGLSGRELLLIYCMVLVAAGIPSFGLTGLLIPYIDGPFYFASPENKYEQTLWPYIPDWLHPHSERAIAGLYEGLREGQAIPWGEWLIPLAAWTLLAFSVYLVFFCLSSLLRRRWVDEEKLVFPLVHLPVELARYEAAPTSARPPALPPFLRSKVMWGFFSVPFLIHTLNGLHYYFPAVPAINVHLISLDAYLTQRPWYGMSPFWLRFLFSIIGLAYLLPSELSFSLWFFYFFFLAQQVIAAGLGIPTPNVQAYPVKGFVAHQMIGGIIAFAVYHLWHSRADFRGLLSRLWRGERVAPDRREALPQTAGLAGVLVGLIGIALWGSAAGAGFSLTLLLFVIYFLVHIVAVRLVCEGGMLYVQHPFRPLNIILAATGSSALGGRVVMLALFDHLFMLDNRSPLMPGIMQSYKMADAPDPALNRRRLTGALVASVVLAVVFSYWSYLRLMYQQGGTALNFWFTTYYTQNLYATWTMNLLAGGVKPGPGAFATMAIGAATFMGIVFMHARFLSWPFHPIGYLMGASWPMINFWFPVFLGWMVKTLVLHYFGAKAYRALLPGFLGLVLAEFFAAGLWVAIDAACGVKGHQIFSF
jgi:hypothetical protein